MYGRTIIRVTLAFAVAVAFLSGGVAAATTCQGDAVDCWADASAETDDERDRTTFSAGAMGGADLNDPEDVTTHHYVNVSLTTGFVDLDAEAGLGN